MRTWEQSLLGQHNEAHAMRGERGRGERGKGGERGEGD